MSGKMNPSRLPRYTASPVEPEVFDALKRALPDGWVAWHSLRFTYGPNQLFREIDFLVLVPQHGLIVIEVKGGHDWRREDGHWYRGKRYVGKTGPLEQVLEANQRLRELLADAVGQDNIPFSRVIVFFPEMFVTNRPSGSDLEDRVLTGSDLAALAGRLRNIVNTALRSEVPALPWTRIHDVLHRAWGESWTPSLQLERVQARRSEELVALDAEQRMLAHDTDVRGRLLVLGGPGTGKSLVAREAARRHESAAKRVVYLCFTRALAIGMRRAGVANAHPIRDFALKVLRDNAIALPSGPSSAWEREAWNGMMDSAAELVGASDVERPDVLVVDEVQDFGAREWAIVDALAPSGIPVLAFGDAGQQILEHADFDPTRFDVTLRLRRAYRTPDVLLEVAAAVRENGSLRLPDSPHIRTERVAAEETVADGVRRALGWLAEKKVAASDIAVLSIAGVKSMTPFATGETIAGLATSRADDEHAPDCVVVDTAVRFKGVERPWVVLIDLDALSTNGARTRAFIGITRATMGVVFVMS